MCSLHSSATDHMLTANKWLQTLQVAQRQDAVQASIMHMKMQDTLFEDLLAWRNPGEIRPHLTFTGSLWNYRLILPGSPRPPLVLV